MVRAGGVRGGHGDKGDLKIMKKAIKCILIIVAFFVMSLSDYSQADEAWVPVKQAVLNQNIYGYLDGSPFFINVVCSNNVSASTYYMFYGDIEGTQRMWCKDGNQCYIVLKGLTNNNWWNTTKEGYEYGQIKIYYATSHDNGSCSISSKWYSPSWSGKKEYFPIVSAGGFDSELLLMGLAGLFVAFLLWDGFLSAYLK